MGHKLCYTFEVLNKVKVVTTTWTPGQFTKIVQDNAKRYSDLSFSRHIYMKFTAFSEDNKKA